MQEMPEEFINLGSIEVSDGKPVNFINGQEHTCKQCGFKQRIKLWDVKETIRKGLVSTPIPSKIILMRHECGTRKIIMFSAVDYNKG